jgi:diaminopimelate decarboxylase
MKPSPPTTGTSWIEISRAALESNLRAFRSVIPAPTQLMAVVKANAYGHGLDMTAPVVAAQADWLGVNAIDEALTLARLGIRKPICILGFTPPEDAPVIVEHGFRQVVYREDVVESLAKAAGAAGKRARIHLKIETGTNRQGIALDELSAFVTRIGSLPGLEVEGVSTHFANIEDTLILVRRVAEAPVRRGDADPGRRWRAPAVCPRGGDCRTLLYPDALHDGARRRGHLRDLAVPETRIAARERGRQIPLEPPMT